MMYVKQYHWHGCNIVKYSTIMYIAQYRKKLNIGRIHKIPIYSLYSPSWMGYGLPVVFLYLEIVDQWSTRIPGQWEGGTMGNTWTATEHCSKSLGFYLPIHTGNVLLKFGFEIQNQTKVRVQKLKYPIWLPGSHFESGITENPWAFTHSYR